MIITLMLIAVLGLCLGSFVNALTWRVHEQAARKSKVASNSYSIVHGRSMCPHCHHTLAGKDLVPVISWLTLMGKCRYCKKSISVQYPLVEVLTASLLVVSYLSWPLTPHGWSVLAVGLFGVWTILLTGLVALAVYDLKWFLLPDRIVFPLIAVGAVFAILASVVTEDGMRLLGSIVAALAISGFFYTLYQLSHGKWIGGGDVKLGVLLGLMVSGISEAMLLLFLSSLLGTFFSLGLVVLGKQKLTRTTRIPFGPFLIAATVIVVLFGSDIINWYTNLVVST